MRKVFFDVATSVDGVMAPPATADESTWMKDWMEIVNWMFGKAFFRGNPKLARGAPGDKDVRIAGGVNTIRQYLNAGLVDEFTLHQAPTVLGRGLRLFDS